MARRAGQATTLPAPFLRRVSLLPDRVPPGRPYPFTLPWLTEDFTLDF